MTPTNIFSMSVLDQNASGDICARKHGMNESSMDAYARGEHTHEQMRELLVEIFRCHPMGLTSKEVGEMLNEPNPNHYAPRLSELKHDGILLYRGQRRNHCEVLQLHTRHFDE